MSTAGTPGTDAPAASDIAARLREAAFVRLVAAGTGDGVAAAALLADTLETAGVAYQTSVVPLPDATTRDTSADLTVALGRPSPQADLALGTDGGPVSPTAFAVAREVGADEAVSRSRESEPASRRAVVLALAGALAAGHDPDEVLLEPAAEVLERRPGVAVPGTDTADGLAHSTLVHAPFSGSVEATRTQLAGLETGRAVASMVALAVAGDDAGTPRGAEAVERVLRPHLGGPVETVGGYADVLDALARERPGYAVAVALGADLEVLPAWRDHAKRAHEAVREARTGRYDGLFVARCDGPAPVGAVARLMRDYRSPEPVALVVGEGRAAMLATPDAPGDVGKILETAAAAVDGEGAGTRTRGRARFDADPSAFVLATREAL